MIADNLIGFDTIPQTIPHFCIQSFRTNNKMDALAYKMGDVWHHLSGTEVIERIQTYRYRFGEPRRKGRRPHRDHLREPARMVADRPCDPEPSCGKCSDLHDPGRRADPIHPRRFWCEDAFRIRQKAFQTRRARRYRASSRSKS